MRGKGKIMRSAVPNSGNPEECSVWTVPVWLFGGPEQGSPDGVTVYGQNNAHAPEYADAEAAGLFVPFGTVTVVSVCGEPAVSVTVPAADEERFLVAVRSAPFPWEPEFRRFCGRGHRAVPLLAAAFRSGSVPFAAPMFPVRAAEYTAVLGDGVPDAAGKMLLDIRTPMPWDARTAVSISAAPGKAAPGMFRRFVCYHDTEFPPDRKRLTYSECVFPESCSSRCVYILPAACGRAWCRGKTFVSENGGSHSVILPL